VSDCLLTIKISQWACENFYSFYKYILGSNGCVYKYLYMYKTNYPFTIKWYKRRMQTKKLIFKTENNDPFCPLWDIPNTRDRLTTFPNNEKRVKLQIGRVVKYFWPRVVWKYGQTLSCVFHWPSQLKLKLRRQLRNKIAKNLC